MKALPQFQFVRSRNVSIGYTRWGQGDHLVFFTPPLVSNIELMWELPEWERVLDWAGRHHQVIMMDKRGVGLSDRVTTSSDLSRAEVADLYRRAHIVACPARFEGFGFPAAEAMACGAAAVASDGGALPEVVGDAGLVSPAGEAGPMADNLARLLDDPGLADELGVRAATRAREAFNWSSHALAASHLYVEALSEQVRA